MGCKKANKIYFSKNFEQFKKMIMIYLIVIMFASVFITPIVFGGPHSDYIYVTFTPTGDISLDVYPGLATFGNVPAGTVNATPSQGSGTSTYTVCNNGSVAAHVYIFSNATTNTSEWNLSSSTPPAVDHFCLKRWNSTGGGFVLITKDNASWIPSLAAAGGVMLFGLSLQLGNVSLGTKLDAQSTRINITGTAA